jgi:hypothetical protein
MNSGISRSIKVVFPPLELPTMEMIGIMLFTLPPVKDHHTTIVSRESQPFDPSSDV